MATVCRRIAGTRDLLPLAAARPDRYPALLESAARGPAARWDILCAFPDGRLAFTCGQPVLDAAGQGQGPRFLDALDAAWADRSHAEALPDGIELPFVGGWLLYLGYELASEIEPTAGLPVARNGHMPDALALRCPAAILVDRLEACTWLVAEPGSESLLDAMQSDLDAAWPAPGPVPAPRGLHEDEPGRFLDGVARVHEHLRAGDTFQVNLSRAWQADFDSALAPAALYAALRQANPAPFAALLQQPGWAIASSSPERLLEIHGGIAQTRPIAGTRARVAGDDEAARVAELLGHAKERAEHVMLVDLERNDLGRVCVPGSIGVDEMMVVESYAHVHHIVSNVRGRLREGVTPGRAIAAMFPGGTITGCPKVRCMQIIAALESTPRGAYTGSLGYLSRDGSMDLNILIRTMVLEGDRVGFRAGAGIVVDSDAAHELQETRAKAHGLLRALGSAAT